MLPRTVPHYGIKNRGIKTIQINLGVIETLVEADGARVAEAAESLDVAPSIAYDHLQTLRSEGYVLNKGGLYYLSDQYL